MASAGKEVNQHREEYEQLIRRDMAEHSARKGCGWKNGAVDRVLNGLVWLIEQEEICEDDPPIPQHPAAAELPAVSLSAQHCS